MSAETGPRPSEVPQIERTFRTIADLARLENEGIHVDSLAQAVDTTPTKALTEEITRLHNKITVDRASFAARKGIISSRRRRRTAEALMRRHR